MTSAIRSKELAGWHPRLKKEEGGVDLREMLFQQALEWIEKHRAEYLGQWVVLEGDRLISHGTDARHAYEEARAAGVETPFLKRVVEENLPFGGW